MTNDNQLNRKVVWEEPPAPRGGASDQAKLSAELKANPGRWARIGEFKQGTGGGMASSIRTGRTRAWQPAGTFEATTRSHGGKTVVYARYVGEDGAR